MSDNSVMEKPKIHVFLGAPTLPVTVMADPDLDCGSWETMELCLLGKSLQPKPSKTVPQDGEAGPSDATLVNDMKADCLTLPSEGLFRLNIDPNVVLERCPLSSQSKEDIIQNNTALDVKEPSQKTLSVRDEQDSCVDVVQEYLNSCFSDNELDPEPPEAQTSPSVSLKTEYLSLWTMSQALVLKGMLGVHKDPERIGTLCTPASPPFTNLASSPELYSPASSHSENKRPDSQGVSQELLVALYEKQEEGGIQLEVTPEGLLCSQHFPLENREEAAGEPGFMRSTETDATASLFQTSPVSPNSKKTRVSPSGVRMQDLSDGMGRIVRRAQLGPTTLLARCVTRGVPYNILVAVIHPCHLKEIKVKSGAWAGSTVPLATIVVTDQSGVERKVVLWRTTAFWALTVYPGEMLLITGVMVNEDRWKGDLVLQSSRSSILLNLGQVTSGNLPRVPCNVNSRTLDLLCAHLKEKHPLLLTLPTRTPQDLSAIPHIRLRALKPDTLVHVVVRVTQTSVVTAWCADTSSSSKMGGVQKSMISVEQGDGQQGEVVLWGAAMSWLHRIQRNKDAVWEFRVLLVKENLASGSMEMHSTPWGSCQPLFPGDDRAQEFCRQTNSVKSPISFEIDLQTLLSQKYTGDVELRCQITGFQFQSSLSQDASPLMNSDTPLEKILDVVSGDITFAGCGRCISKLGTDANGIYRPCYPCLPHTSVRRYYRPAMLMVKERSSKVCIQVPPILVQKILQNIPPEKLSKSVAPSSDRRFVHVVADVLHSLLSAQSTVTLTMHSHFLCDENSIPIVQDFLLLDFDPQI